jgi:hypothetical protein
MARMRTQSEVMAYIKQQDPQTSLTPWALRNMILTGKIPSIEVGRKRLIDLDTLDRYLSPTPESVSGNKLGYGNIRPVVRL